MVMGRGKKLILGLASLVLGFGIQAGAQTASKSTYKVDPANSEVIFSIEAKCRMLPGGYTVRGQFSQISGTIELSNENLSDSRIRKIELPIETIVTETLNPTGCAKVMPGDDETRDEHLRSSDFFDVANFSTASFKSLGRIEEVNGNEFLMRGRLTIKGMPQTVNLQARLLERYQDESGRNHAVFEAETTIDRTLFGVGPASGDITGLGSAMIKVSNELTLSITLDAYEVTQ